LPRITISSSSSSNKVPTRRSSNIAPEQESTKFTVGSTDKHGDENN